MQAVEEEDKEGSGDEFGGGVLHKRQRAAAQDEQSDGEAADLQQVTTHTPCFNDWQPALSRTILYLLPFMMHCPLLSCLVHSSALPCTLCRLAANLWGPTLLDPPDSHQSLNLLGSVWG